MTHSFDHSTDTVRRRDPGESLDVGPPSAIGGLTDRQATIAVMVAGGRSCEDIAADLFLPVRAVQGHLHHAMKVLGLSSVEELTYAAVASRSVAEPPAPSERSTAEPRPSALAALDAAEAAGDAAREADELAELRRELAATQTLLDQKTEKVQQLQQAVTSRDTIGQAKGILMERHKVSADRAFMMLQQESSHTNRKLVHVAEQLVFSGREEPPAPPRQHHDGQRRA